MASILLPRGVTAMPSQAKKMEGMQSEINKMTEQSVVRQPLCCQPAPDPECAYQRVGALKRVFPEHSGVFPEPVWPGITLRDGARWADGVPRRSK